MRQNQVLVLHLRGTTGDPFGVYEDFLRIAQIYLRPETKIHIHCFTGPSEFLEQLQRLRFPHFLIGINSLAVKGKLHTETEKAIYDDYQKHVVFESDAPHMSYDNNINYPHSVYFVAAHLSRKWQMNLESLLDLANSTFIRFYEPWNIPVASPY